MEFTMEWHNQLWEQTPGYASTLHHDHAEIQLRPLLSGGLGLVFVIYETPDCMDASAIR